jgi:hypothetical protein
MLPPQAAYRLLARALRRAPGFSLFAAVVAGAATGVCSVLKPLVFAPLPFGDTDALVWIAKQEVTGVASLSHGFWRQRFGGDPIIVGRSILLNDVPAPWRGFCRRA